MASENYDNLRNQIKKNVNSVLSSHLKEDQRLVFKTDYCLMQVKVLQNALREHSAILLASIRLSSAFKTFVLSIFEWLLKTGLTVEKNYGVVPSFVLCP